MPPGADEDSEIFTWWRKHHGLMNCAVRPRMVNPPKMLPACFTVKNVEPHT